MHSFTLSHTTPQPQTTSARPGAHFLRPVLRGMICALLVAGLFFAAGPAGQPVEAAASTDDRAKPTFATENASPAEASRRAQAVHAVVINEINYNAPTDADSRDWIELYNAGTDDADLTGWKYSDEDDTHVFTFPDGTVLKSGAYLVVAQEIARFAAIHPGVSNVVGDADFGLAGGGELVRIFDASGAIADSLTYDDKAPWPEEADGGGYTLALADPTCDNYLPECWKASPQMHGSPGAPNFPTMASDDVCRRPEGIPEIPASNPTAKQVEDGDATLTEFVNSMLLYLRQIRTHPLSNGYTGCLLTHEGPWHYGSTYIVTMTPKGRLALHGAKVVWSGRLLDPDVLGAIRTAAASSPRGGAFELGNDDAYAGPYFNPDGSSAFVTIGLDIMESHLVDEPLEPGEAPAVTARDVTNRETLKMFVDGAADYLRDIYNAEGYDGRLKIKRELRDPNGYWRHGPVYLFTMDRTGYTFFHGAFPEKYEFQTPTNTLIDAVTGELILPQIITAAGSSPEGGFVEYHFDNPDDDSDSVEIPKVTFALEREFTITLPDNTQRNTVFIMGAGIYETGVTSVEPVDGEIPAAFALEQNYPNPFNPSTTIRFSLEQAQAVTLTVYDMLGREVRVLADGVQPAGNYSVSLDGANLAGGTYLYVLRTGQHVSAKKMTLLK